MPQAALPYKPTTQYFSRFANFTAARWSIFFDALLIKYHYHTTDFIDISPYGFIEPDFFLPQVKMWAQVFPHTHQPADLPQLFALHKATGFPVLFLDALPAPRNYWATDIRNDDYDPDGNLIELADSYYGFSDYVMGDDHNYHLYENRFYGNTGASYPNVTAQSDQQFLDAVNLALSAEFTVTFPEFRVNHY